MPNIVNYPNVGQKRCYKCQVPITDFNCPRHCIKAKNWICRKCYSKLFSEDSRRRQVRIYDKNNDYLRTIYSNNKRLYPKDDKCELCGKINQGKFHLSYHHWDNKDISKGIWIHQGCHSMITTFETMQKSFKKYLKLRRSLDERNYIGSRP